jgi:glycosyltransferase involved in cell wall biosynthesis
MITTNYKYSFILPIYNPGNSLITTLKYYNFLTYNNFEIVLIDDSIDNTFNKMELAKLNIKNLKYFHRKKKDGLDAAFNFGIKNATGDIIVMATDDNLPPKKFLNQLNEIYNNGYDFVIGRSKVHNSHNFYALYQSSYENFIYSQKNYRPKWSEGFSVKKKCIEEIGLYPNIGIDGGNDNMLSEKLEKKFKVKRDFNLIMYHRAPDNFSELFLQQIQRGSAGPQFDLLYYKKSKIFILTKYIIKFFIFFLNFIFQIYFFYTAILYFEKTEKKNILKFLKIIIVINMKNLFHTIGEIKSIKKIL